MSEIDLAYTDVSTVQYSSRPVPSQETPPPEQTTTDPLPETSPPANSEQGQNIDVFV